MDDSIVVLARQYFQLLDVNFMTWPPGEDLKAWPVQCGLYENLFDAQRVSHLPPDRYRLRVLKRMLDRIEKAITDPEEDEISDDLMSHLSSLLSANLPSEAEAVQDKVYVTYNFTTAGSGSRDLHVRPVTLLESRDVIAGQGTTGLRTWEAALHLGSFLCSDAGTPFVEGKTVLELGAGTGLVSLLAAKHLGAKRVVATDGVETVVDAISTNMFVNDLEGQRNIEASALKWGFGLTDESIDEDYAVKDLDVVVGADITYDKGIIGALMSTIWQLFELKPELQVLIAATVRNESTLATFITACNKRRFGVRDIDFMATTRSEQKGPFYDVAVPIRILHITSSDVQAETSTYASGDDAA